MSSTYKLGYIYVIGPTIEGFDDIVSTDDIAIGYPTGISEIVTRVWYEGRGYKRETIYYQNQSESKQFVIEKSLAHTLPSTVIGPPATYEKCFWFVMRAAYNEYKRAREPYEEISVNESVRNVFKLHKIIAYEEWLK